jgi:carbamoyl-phosphate synthase small subunit
MFCYEFCTKPSNATSKLTLNDYLLKYKIPGLSGINTREVITNLRDKGVVKAKLVNDIKNLDKIIKEIKAYKPLNALDYVPVKKPTVYGNKNKYNIALYDFGVKMNIVRELLKRNCKVTLFPPTASYEEMMKIKPDGFLISNGPCDPKDNVYQVAQIKKMIDKDIPMFGICLGHQMIGLAAGFDTKKLKYGHRGSNHPCQYVDGKCYLTSQNHGYYVDNKTVDKKKVTISFTNTNDDSVEGMIFKNKKFIETAQFHPEACAGPNDTNFLFDNFINALKKKGAKK